MAADSGRGRSLRASQACFFCRTRKKKCDKAMPSCTYCIRKELKCVYARVPIRRKNATYSLEVPSTATARDARPPPGFVSSGVTLSASALRGQSLVAAHQDQVYSEVHKTIRATGQFVDDISARYFQWYHHHLPVISRTRFYNNLITLGSVPAADFSVLLLSICLITYTPALGCQSSHDETPAVELQSLYLTAKSLLAQVQASCAPSVSLIQAGLLVALYEYTHCQSDNAFVTLTSIARMAYAARIHLHDSNRAPTMGIADHNEKIDHILEIEEAANTWWGIVICERTFFCELVVFDQPLITTFPGGDARLPVEPQVLNKLDMTESEAPPNIAVSCLTSTKIRGFGRTAQATCLLDKVLKSFDNPDIDSKLLYLDRLDASLQEFLAVVMPQCASKAGVFCSAVNIAIRALISLHCHILDQQPQAVTANFKSIDEWYRKSQEALGTAAKMVVDIAESLVAMSTTKTATNLIDGMPPTYQYLARATSWLIQSGSLREDADWQKGAQNVIQTSLDKYYSRWHMGGDKTWFKVDMEKLKPPS